MVEHRMPNFDSMGETDVREDILAPLLSRLGYSNLDGGLTRIQREHRLTYPSLFLGRKKPRRDPAIVGFADYTLTVSGHANWTLEAKAPDVALDADAVEQAWSYAAHPEVRAVVFALSNGRQFQVHATSAPPSNPPILSLRFEEIESRFDEISAILGPAAIARRFPNHLQRSGKPLGPGLTALERISSGTISYNRSSIDAPLLSQMQVAVVGGLLYRDPEGYVCATLKTRAPFREFQDRIEAMGLDEQRYESNAAVLSVNPFQPTELAFADQRELPAVLDHTSFLPIDAPFPIVVTLKAVASCCLRDHQLVGSFVLHTQYRMPDGPVTALAEGEIRLTLG